MKFCSMFFKIFYFLFRIPRAVLPKLTMGAQGIIAVLLYPVVSQIWEIITIHIHKAFPKTTTTPLIDLRYAKSFAANALPANPVKPTTVSPAASNSDPTIATFATCGCPTKNHRTTASTAGSVASGDRPISNTATSVACALTRDCTNRTIARRESTAATAPSARNTSLAVAAPRTKCRAGTPFTGIVFANWQRTIRAAPCARKRRKRATA